MLQGDCLDLYVQGKGHHTSLLFAVPNGELRDRVTAAIMAGISQEKRLALPSIDHLMPCGQGVVPGAPDLILLTPPATVLRRFAERVLRWWGIRVFMGQTTLIELKAPADPMRGLKAGTQSYWQELFMVRSRRMEFDYRVIDDISAWYDLLKEKGLPMTGVPRPWTPVYPAPAKLPTFQRARRPKAA